MSQTRQTIRTWQPLSGVQTLQLRRFAKSTARHQCSFAFADEDEDEDEEEEDEEKAVSTSQAFRKLASEIFRITTNKLILQPDVAQFWKAIAAFISALYEFETADEAAKMIRDTSIGCVFSYSAAEPVASVAEPVASVAAVAEPVEEPANSVAEPAADISQSGHKRPRNAEA